MVGSYALDLPRERDSATLRFGDRELSLSNLRKPFWPARGLTKRDLLQYYADMAGVLLPHVVGRPMVMKRYPNGWQGKHFFMKRTPAGAPDWLETCSIEHRSGHVIDFPVIRNTPGLLWLVNLGCIDLNPWYSRCDDIDRPDFLHFDLDPVPPADFGRVRRAALLVRDVLAELGMPAFAKTTGSRGIHVYVPIVRGPVQKTVWRLAKALARVIAERASELITTEYRIRNRPPGRVLVDYNQNAWGRTLASVYSVRPTPGATVSTPVAWEEVARGVEVGDFSLENVPARVQRLGDLWRPLTWPKQGRVDLSPYLRGAARRS